MESAAEPDVKKEPDAWDLFRHYDELYFRGALVDAAFTLQYVTPRARTISSIGSCSFAKTSKTITLHRTNRTSADLKNALLHLMIHAIIFVKHGMNSCSSHGPVFRDWMEAINTCSIEDSMRPKGGYCITTTHDFSREKLCSIQGNLWKCESCGVTLVRATRLGPPSDSCCIENVSQHATCGNILCHWHNHKTNCGGTYVVPGGRGQKMVRIGKRGLLTETSKSQEAVQESDSDEVQENSTVAKPIAESKILSQVYCRNARAPGSSSSKKASKSNMTEDYQKAIVLPATPWKRLKPKQEPVASEKPEVFSMESCKNAKSLGSCSSKKADDFQKAIVVSASSPSKLKRKQTFVASEKHELISLRSCNNARSSRTNSSSMADKWHKPEHVQKKPKLEQDLVVLEKYGAFSLGSCKDTKPPRSTTSRDTSKCIKPEGVKKSSVPLAAPLKKLKLEPGLVALEKDGDKPLGSSAGNKVGQLHKPECVQKVSVPLAATLKTLKLEPGLAASEKHGDAKPPLGSSTGNKLGQLHKPECIQKASVPLAANVKTLKLEPGLAASEKHGDAKPPLGSSTGNKLGELQKPECIQKASVLPAARPRNLKQDLVASQKKELSSFVGRSNANVLDTSSSKKAHKQHEHEETRKPVAQPAAPQSILKQQNKTNSSFKAGKQQHDPEDFRVTFSQPAVSQRKLKQSNLVAPKRPRTRSKTTSSPKKKQYACVSVWAGIYESECSSGSEEPLVNKRTERRKREREARERAAQSKKRSSSGISSQPAEKEISSQRLEVIGIDDADEVVTQDPRGQSKAPAPRVGIAAVPPADQVTTQTPGGQSQLPTQPMDIVIPPADLAMTQALRDPSSPFRRMDIAAVPPADQVMIQAPRGQSQPLPRCVDFVIPPAYLAVMTQANRDAYIPSRRMDIAAFPPADQVMTQAPRGQPQPLAQCMDIAIPPADLVMTRSHGDMSVPSACIDIVAVPPADQVTTRAPIDQSQPPAASAIATAQVVPRHSATPPSLPPSNPSSCPDVIDIPDDDE
ncbi:unnamed protein product [Alopecurus aequalis]